MSLDCSSRVRKNDNDIVVSHGLFHRNMRITLLQGIQKGCPAVASEGPTRFLGVREGLNDARTTHGKRRVSARWGWAGKKSDFFSILLAG
jgi:hypothetical protein